MSYLICKILPVHRRIKNLFI